MEIIKENLKNVADKTQILVGIRNGITSVQSILSLIEIGIFPFAVDTATSRKIFHPKIFAAYNDDIAHVILGSANLTLGGLNQNIEASSLMKLDRNLRSDENFFKKLSTKLTALPIQKPNHVFQIKTVKKAVALLREGRLEDERLTRLPQTNIARKKKGRDNLKPIKIFEKDISVPKKAVGKRKVKASGNWGVLVWKSKPLTESNLNIISRSPGTHVTGRIGLGKGLMDDIHCQSDFREIVFSDLNWSTNPNSIYDYIERAEISAELIVKNISYGSYTFEVTHNPQEDTPTREQNNIMTYMKWGEAKSVIAKPDLLGRTMKLYKKDSKNFVIVID